MGTVVKQATGEERRGIKRAAGVPERPGLGAGKECGTAERTKGEQREKASRRKNGGMKERSSVFWMLIDSTIKIKAKRRRGGA
jgi:hypothetical protein